MKMVVALALIPLTWSTMSAGQMNYGNDLGVHEGAPRFVIDQQYRDVLLNIRTVALKQRTADGGRLTAAHAEKIQYKIDEAKRFYRNQLWKNDPGSVNPDGSLRQ